MNRIESSAICALALIGACSSPGPDEPSPALVCAAEAIRMARSTTRPAHEQDLWRAKASLLADKIPAGEDQQLRAEVDRLADRASGPLAEAAKCDALLTAEDRQALDNIRREDVD
jgi:hypothetical protein